MSVREMHFFEKIAWIVVLVTFTYLEIRAINRSDQQNFQTLLHQNDHSEAMAAKDEQIRQLREALQACRLQLLQSNNNSEYADEALNMASEALEAK